MITHDGSKKYISTTNPEKSNWVRYIRPAPTRKQRNVSSVFKDDSVYFVACRNIAKGDEILYWMDDPDLLWTKKKGEKKSTSFCEITKCKLFHNKTKMKMFINILFLFLQIAVAAMLNFPIPYTTDCIATSFMIPIIP